MTGSGSLAERVAKIEAMMPSSDRDGRDQWDAINGLREGMGDLKIQIGAIGEKNGQILDRLKEVKDRQTEASKERSGMELRNAEAIAELTEKIDAMSADMVVLKDSRQTNSRMRVIGISGFVSLAVGLIVSYFKH